MASPKNCAIVAFPGGGGALPLPDSITYGTEYNWQTVELGVAGLVAEDWNGDLSVLENLTKAAKEKTGSAMGRAFTQGSSHIANTVSNVKQIAPNPKEAINFKGVTFRQYTLTWTLMATSGAQMQKYKNLINSLHVACAPELVDSKFFWKYPPSGVLYVIGPGGRHILKEREVYLKSIDVDLNASGDQFYATYEDGNPVAIKLDLGFIEKALPSKENDEGILG